MKISVVIPMFNASRTVLKCVRALAEQDTLPYEVIIVDNNSTDNSKAIVQGLADTFKHLNIILCQESKKGPSAARNRGVHTAAGDIIAFTDSDCMPDKSWIKSIEEAFTQDKDLGAIGGVDKVSTSAVTAIGKFLAAYWLTCDDLPQSLLRSKEDFFAEKLIITFNCAFKRDLFLKMNGFDESFQTGEDIDITLRILDAGGKIVVWNKHMMVCHDQDISFRSMLRREFYYAQGLLLNIDRHFRNNVFFCIPHKYCHWPGKMGLTVVVMPTVQKFLLLTVLLSAAALISPVLLGCMLLLMSVYFGLDIRKRVRSYGGRLTAQETFMSYFIYLAKIMSTLYGRIYWSFRYKIICL